MSTSASDRPHPARFSFEAERMAPRLLATQVDLDPNGGATRITYECGHSGEHNAIFHHVVGRDRYRCRACGMKAASELPEFAGWFDERGCAIETQPTPDAAEAKGTK
jgi:hypothetical protein